MQASRLTSRGRITIRREVRQKIGLKLGDRAIWIARGGEVVLITAKRFAERTSGHLAGTYGKSCAQVRLYLRRRREGGSRMPVDVAESSSTWPEMRHCSHMWALLV